MLKQLVEMRKQLKELQQQETVAKELDCQRNALTLLGVISESAQKTKGRLRVTKFEISNFQSCPRCERWHGEGRRLNGQRRVARQSGGGRIAGWIAEVRRIPTGGVS